MRKEDFLRKVAIFACLAAMSSVFVACEEIEEQIESLLTSVTLSQTSLTLEVGGSATLTAVVVPSDKTVTWKSSDESVASVSSTGTVTGKSVGKATVTATTTDGAKSATCEVTVIAPSGNGNGNGDETETVAVTGVTVSPSAVTLKVGETAALTATVEPANATNKSVTWNSSNTSVATVSVSGVVTAVSEGTATIGCITGSGAKSATCVVTVTNQTTTKKYITYNQPVTAYYIEYNGGMIDANKSTSGSKNDGLVIEAYENGKYSHIDWWGDIWAIFYYPAPNSDWYYNAIYGSNEWMRETNQGYSGVEYKKYPLDWFAAWVTKDKTSGGDSFVKHRGAYDEDGHLFGYGLYANAYFPNRYELPNHTDVTQFYIKSEKVCDILCDVYQDTEKTGAGTRTWTFWVDPSTGFTLKYETIDYDGDIMNAYEVTKLVVGKPEWDGKHLHPLTTDNITDSGY